MKNIQKYETAQLFLTLEILKFWEVFNIDNN